MTHPYVQPRNVTAPQGRWTLDGVLYNEGPTRVAIAFGAWDGERSIAMRWNGSGAAGDALGNPQSSGHPTWFILPSFVAAQVLSVLVAKLGAGDRGVDAAVLRRAAAQFADVAAIP